MSSYFRNLPSIPSFKSRATSTPSPESIAAAERTAAEALARDHVHLFESSDTTLDAADPWRTQDAQERYELHVRLIRYHLLHVAGAAAQLAAIAAWRTSHCPWRDDLVQLAQSPAAGIPMQVLRARGFDRAMLVYLPARLYVRAAVDHSVQQRAVTAFFEHSFYKTGALRAPWGVYVFDFRGLSTKNVDIVGTRHAINIFLSYYPETVKRVLVINFPRWIHGTWKVVSQLLDTRTIAKVSWISDRQTLVDMLATDFQLDDIPHWLGGTNKDEPFRMLSGVATDEDPLDNVFDVPPSSTKSAC